jgi:O-antigen/teichoic acid export membrane protein
VAYSIKMPETLAPTRDKDLHRSLFGAACLSIQPLLLNALSIPAMALIIRRLGPANYGQWVTATSLITAVGFLTSLGLRGKFVRSVAQDPASAQQALAEQLGTRLALTLVAAAVVIGVCLALHYSPVVLKCTVIASIGMLLTTVWSTLADLMQALERFPTIASVNFASGFLLTVASVLVILAGGGPVPLSAVYLVGPLVSLAAPLAIFRRQHISVSICFRPRKAWQLIWECRHFTVQQFLSTIEGNAVALMLPKLIGPASFGVFSAGALLADRLCVIPEAIGAAVYPLVSKLVVLDARKAARRAVQGIASALFVGACISLAATIAAGAIARILLPSAAADCRRVIVLTVWALPIIGVRLAMGYALLGAHREASQATTSAVSVSISIPIGIVLLTQFGVPGACVFLSVRSAIRIFTLLPDFARTFLIRARLTHVDAGARGSPAVCPVS